MAARPLPYGCIGKRNPQGRNMKLTTPTKTLEMSTGVASRLRHAATLVALLGVKRLNLVKITAMFYLAAEH